MENNINWPEAIFVAESEKEPFTNMQVVTARSQFICDVNDMAISLLIELNLPLTQDNITNFANLVIRDGKVKVKECAIVDGESVFVCINEDKITDESMWKALDMVYKAIDNDGSWSSDEELTF